MVMVSTQAKNMITTYMSSFSPFDPRLTWICWVIFLERKQSWSKWKKSSNVPRRHWKQIQGYDIVCCSRSSSRSSSTYLFRALSTGAVVDCETKRTFGPVPCNDGGRAVNSLLIIYRKKSIGGSRKRWVETELTNLRGWWNFKIRSAWKWGEWGR